MLSKDLMNKEIIGVDKDESIERVINLMKKHRITKFPVLEDGELIGIVSDEEIVDKLGSVRTRTITPSSLHVSSIMARDFFTVSADEEISKVIDRAKLGGIGIFPVLEDSKLLGVITKSDLLPLVESEKTLEEIMVTPVKSLAPDDRIVHARRLMVDNGIERLPVLREGRVEGILAAMDLALFLYEFRMRVQNKYQQARLDSLLVEHAMKRDIITASKDVSAKEAAQLMHRENIGCLPLVDVFGKITGIVTRTDVIKEI
ncbi:MAG: CBS domain-containing protein [Candidatus Thermoplasmatota archaeon]|nr:CBS domain-containing protein [Candidatus Thermoplasmatota archaeon]